MPTGRRFDKNGNLLPWWSNDTIQSFVNMTQCFVDQYSNFYIPELGEHVCMKMSPILIFVCQKVILIFLSQYILGRWQKNLRRKYR